MCLASVKMWQWKFLFLGFYFGENAGITLRLPNLNISMREVDTLVQCDICFIITIEIAIDKLFISM